jgi:hypothetical protein
MAIILAYWLFLTVLFLPAGILLKHIFKLTTQNPVLLIILGMVLLTAGCTTVAFFYKLGAVNVIGWSCFSLVLGFIFRRNISSLFSTYYKKILTLPNYLKFVLLILFTGALLKSAQYPFVIDNESYYIQTIKWLNNYGFVKGLANLHPFFAQNSSWHVLQAGLNFSFITNRINDINSFLFIITTLYFVTEGYAVSTRTSKYWLAFMPLLSVLLFQFLQAPSPDMPCLLLTPIIYHLYIQSNGPDSNSKIAYILFVFLVIIKITILPIAIIFLPLIKHQKFVVYMVITTLLLATVWIIKNVIISGYPLYPLAYIKTGYDWALPTELFNFMITATQNDGYYNSSIAPAVNTWGVKLTSWIRLDGLAGIINKFTIALLLILLFTKTIKRDKKHILIYISLIISFLALLFTSPQFRYFLHVTIMAFVFITATIYNQLKLGSKIFKVSLLAASAAVLLLFLNVDLSGLTPNKFHRTAGNVRFQQIYLPEENTKFPNLIFIKTKKGNLTHYSPKENFFLFGTANGPLPCVNSAQLDFFQNKLGFLPQLRSDNLTDGFYSVKAKK